jgi:hypothetical protein
VLLLLISCPMAGLPQFLLVIAAILVGGHSPAPVIKNL